MPTIRLTDNLGLDLNIAPDPVSALVKYIRNPELVLSAGAQLAGALDITIDKVPFEQVSGGLSFSKDVEVGAGPTEMTIGAGLSGSIGVYQAGSKVGPEHFRAPVIAGDNQAYLSLGIKATLSPSISSEVNNLSFGFNAGAEIVIHNHKPFPTEPPTIFRQAMVDTIKEFTIPGDIEDLENMPLGTVASVVGVGKLKLSASAELSQSTSLLASPDLPLGLGPVKVKAGGSLSADVAFQVKGEYQVRVRKLDTNRVQLGYYNRLGKQFDISASASYGLSAKLGKTELISRFLGMVSSDAQADEKALAAAGLSEKRIGDIEEGIAAGVDRSLAASLSFEFSALSAEQAAFLYEISLDQLTAEGRRAIHMALDGDLTALTKPESETALRGITTVRTILTHIANRSHSLKVNLLGIYNFISISEMLREGEILFEPESGGLVLTDKATANRIRAAMVNFGADADKLRAVLAERFLITAAYRASQPGEGPDLTSNHSYFEYHAKTNRQTMKDNLDAVQSVGFIDGDRKQALLGVLDDFGRSWFVMEAAYDSSLCGHLFLDGNNMPRAMEEYERIGRKSLVSLIDAGDADDYRLEPLRDDALWRAMRAAGPAALKSVLPASLRDNDVKPAVIASDYVTIVWWADTMHSTGEVLAEVLKYRSDHPNLDPENNEFKKLRNRLADHLADVARKTKEHFSDPWGLVAMDMASSRRAELSVRLTSAELSLTEQRQKAIPAGGGGQAG